MRLAFALLLCPFLAGSALAQDGGPTLDAQLNAARAEQSAAEAEAARLERVAANSRNQADRLRTEQAAAAKAIEAAEARITSANAQAALASAFVAAHRRRLIVEQRPAALLLAGLAVMAQRPPLLALAGGGSTDELVKVRILLDSTLPAIRSRTNRISAQLAQGERLQQTLTQARAEMVRSQQHLVEKRRQFAVLEQEAMEQSVAAGGRALASSDIALAVGEETERLRGAQSAQRSISSLVSELASQDPAPPRPTSGEGGAITSPFAYELPATAAVTEGLAAVNASGMRSRGLTLGTSRGDQIIAPAAGTVRFSGPFQGYDGVLIIDHGRGWISLLVNVSSTLKTGQAVRLGEPVGRALGPLLVELSQNGRRISPALITGSSQSLSKRPKGG